MEKEQTEPATQSLEQTKARHQLSQVIGLLRGAIKNAETYCYHEEADAQHGLRMMFVTLANGLPVCTEGRYGIRFGGDS